MTLYLDASVLVSLLVEDAHTPRADALTMGAPDCLISTWTAVEAVSAVNRLARMGTVDPGAAADAIAAVRDRSAATAQVLATTDADMVEARRLLERTRTALRAPDALHLAIAKRAGLRLATFDDVLATAAREVGVQTAA